VRNRTCGWLLTALLTSILAACAPSPTATSTQPADPTWLVAETEASIPNPTVTPVTPLPENLPPGLPVDFSPNELAVAQLGKAAYSGFNCTLEAETCTCDQPTIQNIQFTFQPGNKMLYSFAGDTFAAQWAMARVSPDQWSYTLRIGTDETSGTPASGGGYFFLITLTDTGFVMAQRKDHGNGEVVTCPDAVFTRMSP
jgi:hypothetical protein